MRRPVFSIIGALAAVSLATCGDARRQILNPDSALLSKGQNKGSIRVETATTGAHVPEGYTVRLNGGRPRSITDGEAVTYDNLNTGDYSVELLDLASHCTTGGANPRSVSVTAGNTTQATFEVTCLAGTGALEVRVTTTGSNLDPDGYLVRVNGGLEQPLEINGTITFPDLNAGEHTVELAGVASNCWVGDDNPRTVSMAAGSTTETTFEVSCSAETGTLEIQATTTGSSLDPDGYTVRVNGGSEQPLAINGGVSYPGLSVGEHTVELSGVASNCTVAGDNPRIVAVAADETSETTFEISCSARIGALQVGAVTTGADLDPDGYTVRVNGGSEQPLAINGTISYPEMSVGEHSVELSAVASNCTVAGENPRIVAVTADETSETTFEISCTAHIGALQVRAVTSGADLDPDGYTVRVNGGSEQPLAINGTVSYPEMSVGEHTVELSGVASNCTVGGENPRVVTVAAEDTSRTTFEVSCLAQTGTLQVRASTTGSNLDPDGYTVRVNGGSEQPLAINGTVSYPELSVGEHTVQLSGVASNCTITGQNPRTVSLAAGATVETLFSVSCSGQGGSAQEVIVRVLADNRGAAALIVNGQSKVVIDGGRTEKQFRTFIHEFGLQNSTLDAVILSHGHNDHYTGLRDLFETRHNIIIRRFYENPLASESGLQKLRDSVNARVARGETTYHSTYDACGDGSVICTLQLDGGAKLHLIRPMVTTSENNRSVLVKLVGPDSASFTMLFPGDAEQPAVNWFLNEARYDIHPGLKVDVLKGNHHGNCGAITHQYIQATSPDWVVFPTKSNDKGYVNTQTKDLLAGYGVRWYRTDENGTVTIRSPGTPGSGYTISVEQGVPNMDGEYDGPSTNSRCNPIP